MLSLFVPVSSLFASSVQLSFGGIPLPGKPGTFLRKNFHGCMENLYYNTINIIDLAKRRKPQIHSVVSLVLFLFVFFFPSYSTYFSEILLCLHLCHTVLYVLWNCLDPLGMEGRWLKIYVQGLTGTRLLLQKMTVVVFGETVKII